MTATTAAAIRKPQTNLSVVTDIMEYSRFGALSQAFVMAALESYSEQVIATPDEQVSNGLLPAGVWKGIAEETLQKLEATGYRPVEPKT